ncbi:MAG: zinc ribbon domain-containing protein [Lachnospiraceae bacterium]|nr:zinc ribbon domain-containing protein [Lachnospiraceae bacterium]
MRCPNCGQRLVDGAHKCPICGADMSVYSQEELYPVQEAAPSAEREQSAGGGTYDRAGNGYTAGGRNERGFSTENDPYPEDRGKRTSIFGFSTLFKYKGRGMIWNFILSNIALVVSAASNMLVGIEFLNGTAYGTAEYTQQVYGAYPGLKSLDMVYGIICFLIGIAAATIRLELVYLKRKGPRHLMMLYIVPVIIGVIYLLIAMGIIGEFMISWETGYQVVFAVIMVLVNRKYYGNRQDIFCK